METSTAWKCLLYVGIWSYKTVCVKKGTGMIHFVGTTGHHEPRTTAREPCLLSSYYLKPRPIRPMFLVSAARPSNHLRAFGDLCASSDFTQAGTGRVYVRPFIQDGCVSTSHLL